MRIGLISTLNTNIGDDFIREGLCLVIDDIFRGKPIDFICINKHKPFTVYPNLHPVRLLHQLKTLMPRGKRIAGFCMRPLSLIGMSNFDKCDLIIQAGTPVAWPNCSRCEWAEPLWYQVVGRLSRKGIPVLNLGAGSGYAWEKQPEKVDNNKDRFYLKTILSYCRVTTTRDRLSQRLFENLGHSCPLIPCPALLAGRPYRDKPDRKEFFVINYMEKGGHYDCGQDIRPYLWERTIQKLIGTMRKQYKILFLCHNRHEYNLAAKLDPTIPRFLPRNSQEYFSVLSRAKFGLCNRLHATIALAGIGVPSLAVGTDTRLLMVETVGLPYAYVKEAKLEKLKEELEGLSRNQRKERQRLYALSDWTQDRYREIIKESLEN